MRRFRRLSANGALIAARGASGSGCRLGAFEDEPCADAALQERIRETGCERMRGPPARAVRRRQEGGRELCERVARAADERLEMGAVQVKANDHGVQVLAAGEL